MISLSVETLTSLEKLTKEVEPVQRKELPKSMKDVAAKNEPSTEVDQPKNEHLFQPEHKNFGHNAMDSLVLLCCKDALCLYSLRSVVQKTGKHTSEKPVLANPAAAPKPIVKTSAPSTNVSAKDACPRYRQGFF